MIKRVDETFPCQCASVAFEDEKYICIECETEWSETELNRLDTLPGSSAETMRDFAIIEEMEWALLLS